MFYISSGYLFFLNLICIILLINQINRLSIFNNLIKIKNQLGISNFSFLILIIILLEIQLDSKRLSILYRFFISADLFDQIILKQFLKYMVLKQSFKFKKFQRIFLIPYYSL